MAEASAPSPVRLPPRRRVVDIIRMEDRTVLSTGCPLSVIGAFAEMMQALQAKAEDYPAKATAATEKLLALAPSFLFLLPEGAEVPETVDGLPPLALSWDDTPQDLGYILNRVATHREDPHPLAD